MGHTVEQTPSTEIVDIRSGEIVSLADADDDFLGHYLQWIRDLESQARHAKQLLSEELHRRMDRNANWTLRVEGLQIKGTAPGAKEYDPLRLRANLSPLVDAGVISEDAMNAAVEPVEEFKVRKRAVTALLKLQDAEVEEAISLSEVPPKARRITLSEES